MKRGSRTNTFLIGVALSMAFGAVVVAQGQNREKYLISAAAGGINYVSGNVTVVRKTSGRQESLTDTDNLRSGDIVTTGAGGRIEVLLNPGSYMRVAENSEFEMTDSSLDNLMVTLTKGSAVVEATGADGIELAIGLNTPQTTAAIVKGGIYRFNVFPNDSTEILVRRGKVFFGDGLMKVLKDKEKVSITRGRTEVAKLDQKDLDSLDLWSKTRAELLARANRGLKGRPLLLAFNNFGWNDFDGWRRPLAFETVGLWVYNPTTRSHCFVPVGGGSWQSPYGHHYGTGFSGGGNGWPGRPNEGYTAGGGGSTSPGGGGGGSTGGGTTVVNNPPQSQPISQPVSQPSSPPPSAPEPAIERGPRREYTTQSPN